MPWGQRQPRGHKHHAAHRVAFHQDGVVHAVHARQWVVFGQQGGAHPHIQLHRAIGVTAQALSGGHELHHVAQLSGVVHIAGVQSVDALGGIALRSIAPP